MKCLHEGLRFLLPKPYSFLSSHGFHLSSENIRKVFMNFFTVHHGHFFLKSSPVVPFCDPSVPFVNAGMNQFKGIFLGQKKPPYERVVNCQKCIRVGGKHNDLENVGSDDHHHTFFEMLGNWSFGDYFKEKACKMAWELLTGPYKLNPEQLYVTYFGGDETMGIEADLETKNIWLNIGVPPERISAFGSKENFWEMGPSGPCGPCTEIHYDHVHGRRNATERVNHGFDDVVEIWNLVFIQYNRNADGSLKRLPCFHVDTGMGLERLVAILQGKKSNYDTDLFVPLFNAVQKISGAPLYTGSNGDIDINYRILADHTRMVTVALADGMFPDQNFKLRRVLRRALNIAGNTFGCKKGLVSELTNYVAETLVDAYPEVGSKIKKVQLMIDYEEEMLKCLQQTVLTEWQTLIERHNNLKELNVDLMPGIVVAFKELMRIMPNNHSNNIVPSDLCFKFYDSYGLDLKTIETLCNHLGFKIDSKSFQNLLQILRKRSREIHQVNTDDDAEASLIKFLMEQKIKPTDDHFKYSYCKEEEYIFPSLESQVQAIVCGYQLVSQISACNCDVIMSRTNLYHDAGGQKGDSGLLKLKNGSQVLINYVRNVQGYLLHNITVPENYTISLGDIVNVEVDSEKRMGCMRNHTATHLVNAALQKTLTVTCQKSSQVSETSLVFEFAVFGESSGLELIEKVQDLVQAIVYAAVPVERYTVNAEKLQEFYIANEVTLVPGEVYPQDGIHIIEITDKYLKSREPCCGTHLLNTADIGDFCITSLKSLSASIRTLSAVTGSKATEVISEGIKLLHEVSQLKEAHKNLLDNDSTTQEEISNTEKYLHKLKQDLLSHDKYSLPHIVRVLCIEDLGEISKKLKLHGRSFSRESLENEMHAILGEIDRPFLVHYLKCSSSMDDVPLQKATKMCAHLPVLLIADSGDSLKARCCVPQGLISANFNAKLWLEQVLSVFKAQGFVPRGQNSDEIFNMKKKYVKVEMKSILINDAITSAKKFAETFLPE